MLKSIIVILLSLVQLSAVTLTVKAGGGGNYTTIQTCASAMSNGDTCVVYAGTYNEHVTLSAGGVGAYKMLQVNGTDLVYVLDFTVSSHNKIVGFHIQNPSSPASSDCITVSANSTDYYLTNNNLYACGSHAMIYETGTANNTSHGFIQGNTLSYSCSTSSAPNVCVAMIVSGDYNLIENNDISHQSDGIYITGTHNVLRKNVFHDLLATDCGSNSGNCHIDFMQADATYPAGQPAQYLLIESNTILNLVGTDMHGMGLFQGEACGGQCFNAIVRFNSVAHVGGGGIVDDNSGSPPPAWINVKGYNNSWVDTNNQATGVGNGTNGFDHGSTGGAQINELFYYPEALLDFNPYECLGGTTPDACSNFSYGHNLAWCTGSPCNLRSHAYGSGSFINDPGNQVANPQFVNYSGNDFRLAASSPAIGAGTFLTTVNSGDSGSGVSLIVNDAGLFQDGSGITGVNADWIRVGTSITAQISSINYSTNTITLVSGISRSSGNPVYLYKDSLGNVVLNGAAPDIGAFPFSTSASNKHKHRVVIQ